jgi:hypothetical protein
MTGVLAPSLPHTGGERTALVTAAVRTPCTSLTWRFGWPRVARRHGNRRGHRVLESGGRFWLVHASDVASVQADIDKIEQRGDLTETERSACVKRRLLTG